MQRNSYLYFDSDLEYPKESTGSPSEQYPEYPWPADTMAREPNKVYDAIRKMFADMKLDEEHYGTAAWNPLGDYIHPGQTVVVKPNFVMHKNGSSDPDDMESLVTHPSVIRCVLDYCLIALQGKGTLIVGDSPVKDCDFALLMERGGYRAVRDFFEQQSTEVCPEFVDFRGPEEEGGQYEQKGCGVLVDLAEESYFYGCDHDWKKYRIPNYDYRKVRQHHRGKTQEYSINSVVLNADVIISLPKPKTHRKNGYTGALKNFVGINYSKEYLPHHTQGSVFQGGDEYKETSRTKEQTSHLRLRIDILRTKADAHHQKTLGDGNRLSRKCHSWAERLLRARVDALWRKYDATQQKEAEEMEEQHVPLDSRMIEGAWHGNDTIWRTVLDLNVAVEYADSMGKLHPNPQRKLLYLADLVVAGEKEGPMSPTPKKVHALLFSEKASTLDGILVKLMGFDWRKFAGLTQAMKSKRLGGIPYSEIEVQSNEEGLQGKLENIDFREYVDPFEAAAGWKNYVELQQS